MQELLNISDHACDTLGILDGDPSLLAALLQQGGLSGIELMVTGYGDPAFFPTETVHGVHLRFWPNWLDFWLGNEEELQKEFGSRENVAAVFGENRAAWLALWRENMRTAARVGARYVVFHVANVRSWEMKCRHFAYGSVQVIDATAKVVNAISDVLPEECLLLYENLWWPGLTLTEPKLATRLIEKTHHERTGFVLDTGHMMNTNTSLTNEEEAVRYILQKVENLGSLRERIFAMHLHRSLSGDFVQRSMVEAQKEEMRTLSFEEGYRYVSAVDRHEPFETAAVRRLIEAVAPEFLVHEFLISSWEEWQKKVKKQKNSLWGGDASE